MRLAIIVSVVVHAAAIVWAAYEHAIEPPVEFVLPMFESGDPEPAKIVELTYLGVIELPSDVQIAAIDPTTLLPPAKTKSSPSSRIAATTGTRGSEATTTETPKSNPETLTMKMRKPEPTKLALSGKFIDDFLSKPRKPVEIPDVPGARIEARIDELLERRRNRPPGYSYTDDLQELVALRDAKKKLELKRQKDGSYESEKTTYIAKVAPDGTVKLVDKANVQPEGLGARFDVTDALMRAVGQDPYRADKLKFLDRTRDQRVAIGNEHRKDQLARSRHFMTANVQRAWASTTDLAARKQLLFELWDDCAETGRDDIVKGAAEAREILVNFIQMKLRGADAYTADELRAFNAKRTSKKVFAPYK